MYDNFIYRIILSNYQNNPFPLLGVELLYFGLSIAFSKDKKVLISKVRLDENILAYAIELSQEFWW